MEKFYVFLIIVELFVCTVNAESHAAFKAFVNYFEVFIIAVFTVEYLLRIFTIEKKRNIFRPLMVIDLFTILPVTGLIFVLGLTFSSVFACIAEHSTFQLASFKNMPPSSFWSIVSFAIFCRSEQISITTLTNFLSSLTPNLNIFALGIAVLFAGIIIFDTVQKKYRSFALRKMTLRPEPSFNTYNDI